MTSQKRSDLSTHPSEAHLALSALRREAGGRGMRRLLSRVRASEEGAELLRARPVVDGETCDLRELMRLPRGTFGREYARWMTENGFHPDDDIGDRPEGGEIDDTDAGYLCERVLQVHDFWHVLTGYNCDEDGELGLLAFTLGQTRARAIRRPLHELVRRELRFAWRTGDRAGRHRLGYLWHAWRRGRRARLLVPIELEGYFMLPLDAVRQRLEIEPAAEACTGHSLPPIAVPA